MFNFKKKPSQLDRREALKSVGVTIALAAASGASGLTGGAYAATPSSNASDRAEAGFWPNGARLAVSLSLMFEGGGQPISGPAASFPIPSRRASRTCRPTPSSPTVTMRASPSARPHGQAWNQAQLVHDRQGGRNLARPRSGDRAPGSRGGRSRPSMRQLLPAPPR